MSPAASEMTMASPMAFASCSKSMADCMAMIMWGESFIVAAWLRGVLPAGLVLRVPRGRSVCRARLLTALYLLCACVLSLRTSNRAHFVQRRDLLRRVAKVGQHLVGVF